MRKLSKKISMLMVLAMLVGMFSGIVSASAASAWSFKSKNYEVAVDGTVVMGNKEYADFDLLKDGKAPTGYTVKWASSNEDVVWVNAKTGQLRANKLGMANVGDKAVISATFTNTATKKSATRSFVIVYGTPEYELVTKIGDVVLGEETLAVGESYKLATTVLDVDGNSVDFKTCKLYRNYFIDGKAIANPYVPEKEGEVTITVAAFAKKADMDDLSKAVKNAKPVEYKVTATTGEFSAEATGLKEITVYGEFAKNSTFNIVKDNSQKVAFTQKIAEDGKTAILTLDNRLVKGAYTVSCGDATVVLDDIEDERVDKIIIKEKDGVVTTSPDRKTVYVHYDLLNQYGDSVRKNYDADWTTSTGYMEEPDRERGVIAINIAEDMANTKDTFIYGSTVVLSGVATSYGYVANEYAYMTVGLENSVDTIDVKGITLADTGKLLDAAPASFLGGIQDYYLVFEMKDRAGYSMLWDEELAKDSLSFATGNPLLIKNFNKNDITHKYINGVEYGAIKIQAGDQLRKGGTAEVTIVSGKTGTKYVYYLAVDSDQVLKEFRILQPEKIAIKNTVEAKQTKVELPFEAYDVNGAPITSFRALYKAVTFSTELVEVDEQDDGSAKLYYYVDKDLKPIKGHDASVTITSIVQGACPGYSSNITLSVKAPRYADSIASYNGGQYLLEGNSIKIALGDKDVVKVYDQYDEKIESRDLFAGVQDNTEAPWLPVEDSKKAEFFAVKVEGSEAGLSVATGSAIDTIGDYYIFPNNADLYIVADEDVTDNIKPFVVKFALANDEGAIVSGSEKSVEFFVADISQVASFNLSTKRSLLENGVNKAEFSLKGTLFNGKEVGVQDETDSYVVDYLSELKAYTDNSLNAKVDIAVPGNAFDTTGDEYISEGILTVTGSALNCHQFHNQAAKNSDGTYKDDVKLDVTTTATVSLKVTNGTVIRDRVKAKFQVATYERAIAEIKAPATKNVQANKGRITFVDLKKFIEYPGWGAPLCIDNYGDNWTDLSNLVITVTNLKESENGLTLNSVKLTGNGQGSLELVGAEIGDTFRVTFEIDNVTAQTDVTVIDDKDAVFTTNKTECEYY